MTFTIDSKTLKDAIARCPSVKDGYSITFFTNNKAGDSNSVFATISACDSSVISAVTIIVLPSKDAVTKKILVGTDFCNAAAALCEAGENIVLDLQENCMKMRSGASEIPVKYKTQVTSFTPKSPKKDIHATFSIETKEFQRIVKQGGFATAAHPENSSGAMLNNICLILNEGHVRAVSCNGYYGASSLADIIDKDQAYLNMAKAGRGICIPPSFIKMLVDVLRADKITVYLFDTQMLLKDGNDVFAFTLASAPYQMKLLNIFDDTSKDYGFKVKVSDLKVALDVVIVNCQDKNKAVMLLENAENGFTVSSCENGNRAFFKAEGIEGTVRIALSIMQVRKIISAGTTETDTVEVYGIGNASPIHICGGHCSAITTPIALPMAAPSEAESE